SRGRCSCLGAPEGRPRPRAPRPLASLGPILCGADRGRREREAMNERILARLLVVTGGALAACWGGGAAVADESGAAYTYPDGSPHPVTPWGDPDLQGMWPIMHLFSTPLQRNPEYGERRYLNDEEWERAQAILRRRDENYYREIESNRMGMGHWAESTTDRKSTRLNSSHVKISYAVFCLKKKRKT